MQKMATKGNRGSWSRFWRGGAGREVVGVGCSDWVAGGGGAADRTEEVVNGFRDLDGVVKGRRIWCGRGVDRGNMVKEVGNPVKKQCRAASLCNRRAGGQCLDGWRIHPTTPSAFFNDIHS